MITTKTTHQGRAVKRIREMQEMKQTDFAQRLSETLNEQWDQPKVSLLEDKTEIGDELLKVIAPILNVTPEIIKNFDPESILSVFAAHSTYNDNASLIQNFQCTFNPIDKLVEVFEENKKLYEKLLDAERKMNLELTKRLEDLANK